MKPLFSIVLIARNESKTLPRLIESLADFKNRGGDILLLDTGSTDETAKIAENLGCRVLEVGDRYRITIDERLAKRINARFLASGEAPIVKDGESLFDYASARNYIADFASTDMIATPDCDEIWTKFDIDRINNAISSGVDQLEYNFVFSHDAEGRELVKFKHSKFYNRKKMSWVGVIHEVLQTKDGQIPNRLFLGEEAMKLEHWQNVETNRAGYLKGLALDCFKNPDNDRNSHYFGRELVYTGRPRSAIKELARHIEMEKWPTERSQSYIHMGEAYLMLGDRANAIGCFANAFDLEPRRRESLMNLADIYYKEKNDVMTAFYASAALKIPGVDFYANYQPYYEHIPHEMLYWAYWQIGDKQKSFEHFNQCLKYQPYNPKYLYDLRFYEDLPKVSFVIPHLGREEGLKRCTDSIKALNYPQDKIEIIIINDVPRLGVPKRLNEGVARATGTWIVFAANDLEFTPDSLIIAYKQATGIGGRFISFNTNMPGETKPRLCEHFLIHRDIVEMLKGKIFDEDFNHVGVDDLLWAKMKKLGEARRCDKAIVHHYHFSRPGGKMDDVYEKGWNAESVERDRRLLSEKMKQLDNEI